MPPGRGRPAAIAAAAAIAASSTQKRSSTPTAGATAASTSGSVITKQKPCIVRIEKAIKKDEKEKKDDEIERKTVTGPLKKRSITNTSTPPPPPAKKGKKSEEKKMHVEEDLSDYTLVTARARRTPKPNPKYSSDDMVTNYSKATQIKSEEESDHPDFDSADDFDANSSDVKEEDIAESDDDDYENLGRRGKVTPVAMPKGRGRSTVHRQEILGKRKIDSSSDRVSMISYNKRINLDVYDASDSDISASSPTPQKILRTVNEKSTNADTNRQASLLRPMIKTVQHETQNKSKPIQILERRKDNLTTSSTPSPVVTAIRRTIRNDNDVQIKATTPASTVDDFETMPTFTIVNINDIINKKSDDILKVTSVGSADPHQQQQQNRRKAIHAVMTDKSDKTSPPRQIYVQKKAAPINNNLNKSLLKMSGSGENLRSTAAPRILNSVVGKKTRPVSPIVSPKNVIKSPQSMPSTGMIQQQRQLKENLTATGTSSSTGPNKVGPPLGSGRMNSAAAASAATTTTAGRNIHGRKLPSDRVIVQRQGNKLVKKMTCYETWYVVQLPSTLESMNKNDIQSNNNNKNCYFDMSLIELGNRIKEVQLPNNNWNYKVTLQRLPQSECNKSNTEVYTGEINDSSISNDEKKQFQPVNIMFRRVNRTNTKQRIPFDRAVIFKNQKYFLNINSKNIRLNGAPEHVSNLDDIHLLLEIINEVDLDNEFVEPTTFMM